MADYEKFSDSVKVAEKTEKEGKKGTYYACKTEKGLVYNVSEDVVNECGGKLKIGETYHMEGVILPPKEGYTHGSKWANKFTVEEVQAPSPTGAKSSEGVKAPANAFETQQNGMKFGNRLSNATALVVAQVDAGKLTADYSSMESALNHWFSAFDNAEKTGKFEVPF